MAKKLRLLIPVLVLVLALCGCSRYEEPLDAQHVVTVSETGDSYSYSLWPTQMELVYNGTTYSYDVSLSGDTITYTVYYPNGGTYYETRGDNAGNSGWNDKYISDSYPSGEKLVNILSQYYYISTPAPSAAHVISAILCLAIGAFDAFFPEAAWHLAHVFRSWQYESVEPSEAGLTWTRAGGVIIIIMGIILFFSNWS